MSYCRWSSDDFKCDLYCYESDKGFVTHIATSRMIVTMPQLVIDGTPAEFEKSYTARAVALSDVKREPLGLEMAGQSFLDKTLKQFRRRLVRLKNLGYRFPDDVLKAVNKEILENLILEEINSAQESK